MCIHDGDSGEVRWVAGPVPALDEVTGLVRRCLDHDGGLPLAAEEGFVRSRWRGEGATGLQARTRDGKLAAAGAVRSGGAGAVFCGLVDPAYRGVGLGVCLLDRGLALARERVSTVTVETESWNPAAEDLFATRGLRRTFLEEVLRYDLTRGVPDAAAPAGTVLRDWSAAGPQRCYDVYAAAFRERPGFPGWTVQRRVEETVDEDFRPAWSLLATLPGIGNAGFVDTGFPGAGFGDAGFEDTGSGDAGFVTAADGWIVQVGVVPSARGRGLGAALVTEVLRRMRASGAAEAWLDVNVDNRARELYRALGFEHYGSRARYQVKLGS